MKQFILGDGYKNPQQRRKQNPAIYKKNRTS